MSDDTAFLRNHIEMLENRLERYHEHLEDAVRERDELAIDAAWGVAHALTYFQSFVFSAAFSVMAFFVGREFVSNLFAILIAVGVYALSQWGSFRALVTVNKARMEEKEGLARLPRWESEAQKLWDVE